MPDARLDRPAARIMLSSAMRSGSALLCNVLHAHSRILVVREYVHFFRFLYRRYDPLDRRSVERLLRELRARIYWRYRVDFDVDAALSAIDAAEIGYPAVYDAIMAQFLNRFGKDICAEDASLNWRHIETFVELFPDAKVLHIVRDPRAVLASWKRASFSGIDYLGCLFNAIDSMDYCVALCERLPSDRYMWLRYEDLVTVPGSQTRRLCDFIGVPFEPVQTDPRGWVALFDGTFFSPGRSAHLESVDGFDAARIDRWREALEPWERAIAETIAGTRIEAFGYPTAEQAGDVTARRQAMEAIQSSSWLREGFAQWRAENRGHDRYPNDPRDPANWGARGDFTLRFLQTADGARYLQEIAGIRCTVV